MLKFALNTIYNLKFVFFLSFILVLSSCAETPQYDVDDVINSIQIGFNTDDTMTFVTQDVTLITSISAYEDASIRWESSDPEVISTEGVVIRQGDSQKVSLILNVRVGSNSKQKIFELTVIGTRVYMDYQVNYYIENIDDEAYELDRTVIFQGYIGEEVNLAPVKEGFFVNEELSSLEGTLVDETFELNVYYQRQIYQINYYNESELIGYQTVKFGTILDEFIQTTKEGYNLIGWSKEPQGDVYGLGESIGASFDLYALWKVDLSYGYYDDITATSGETLLLQLRELLNSTMNPITYGDARDILQESDADPNIAGNIILVYIRASISGIWDSGLSWNREHVWPQSLLGSSAANSTANVASDLQNLKPAYPSENTSRSNKYYANETTFESYEPHDDVKGDVARILFYMITMYDYLELVNEKPIIHQMAMLNILIEWHEQDPVDDFERNRNDVLFKYQKNRNPYIDFPEYVELVITPEVLHSNSSDNTLFLGETQITNDLNLIFDHNMTDRLTFITLKRYIFM